jgi:hypothetical protein
MKMPLRGKKPEEVKKRLKAFFYGAAKVGKTTCAIQFPCPYLIDTEKGAENEQYVELLKKQNSAVFQTSDFEEMTDEIYSLMSEKHEYKTLIIDPLTIVYNDLLEKAGDLVGTDFGRHYGEANKKMKHLVNLLLRIDMNVIITSHSKNEYGDGMKIIGTTFDCYRKMDFLFDFIVEVQKRGSNRIGVIKGSRIKSLPDGDQFPFGYEYIEEKYGKSNLEREVEVEILATKEQVENIKYLIELIKVPEQIWRKWLDKAAAQNWEEMPEASMVKCLDLLNSKINNKGE